MTEGSILLLKGITLGSTEYEGSDRVRRGEILFLPVKIFDTNLLYTPKMEGAVSAVLP